MAPPRSKPSSDPESRVILIEDLEEELENAGLALFLKERVSEGEGEHMSADDFLAEIGMRSLEGRSPPGVRGGFAKPS